VCVRTGKKPQISPLRCASVEMTILSQCDDPFSMENLLQLRNKFVISTRAQRSGEICGFFPVLTHPRAQFWVAPKCKTRHAWGIKARHIGEA
jgi:hypothetical protein